MHIICIYYDYLIKIYRDTCLLLVWIKVLYIQDVCNTVKEIGFELSASCLNPIFFESLVTRHSPRFFGRSESVIHHGELQFLRRQLESWFWHFPPNWTAKQLLFVDAGKNITEVKYNIEPVKNIPLDLSSEKHIFLSYDFRFKILSWWPKSYTSW